MLIFISGRYPYRYLPDYFSPMQNVLKYIFLLVLMFGTFQVAAANEINVSGCIYNDKNENGIKDKSESGIKNIPVSDGRQIVLTNSKGIYSLKTTVGNSVFPILPSEYSFSDGYDKVVNSNFKYLSLDVDAGNINFSLVKKTKSSSFSFAAVGDIQVGDEAEMNYAAQSIGVELASSNNYDFHLFLGDLVNDNPPLLPVMKNFLSNFQSPTWTVYGNHDRFVSDSTTTDQAYNKVFGSSVYAFNRGQVHFIVLNNITPKGRKGYEGKLSDAQFEFVENDLKLVPDDYLVVISQHIPLRYIRNGNRLLELLDNRKHVLLLSGHTHTTERYFYKTKNSVIHELGVGASCGNWWTGEKNGYGVPHALMQCGSLPNYYVVDVDKNKYSIRYKGIGQDSGAQMGVWVELSAQAKTIDASANDSIQIVSNVFGGSDSTEVSVSLNNAKPIAMTKVKIMSPNVNQLIDMNKANVYPTPGSVRNPLRKSPSPHIWVVSLPPLKSGLHQLEISAFDRFGLNVSQKQQIYIP